MCTLGVAFRTVPGQPLVVAANRDERLARPAEPPLSWPGETFVAPRDVTAGGTWLGIGKSGLFVGVTNRFGAPNDLRRASRGSLVVDALRGPRARDVRARLEGLPPDRYNPFHLFYADPEEAFVTWCDGAAVRHEVLRPGLHVVTERSLGGDDRARTELVRAGWEALGPTPSSEGLMDLMRRHGESPLGGTCVHVPVLGYGTRSSLVLRIAETRADSAMFWCEGSPCTNPFVDRSELLDAVLGA